MTPSHMKNKGLLQNRNTCKRSRHSWQGMCEGGGLGAPFTVQITRPQAKIPQEAVDFLRNFKEALQNATPPCFILPQLPVVFDVSPDFP